MTTRKTTTPRRSASPGVRKPAATPARRPGAVRRKKATSDEIPAAVVAEAAAVEIADVEIAAVEIAAVEIAAVEVTEVEVAPAAGFEASAEEQIRVRAYFLHLERRGRPADPVEDWLCAERERVSVAGV
jgi:hypothetical protein